jgi:NDP-sugar pyrophosphorylase family protein
MQENISCQSDDTIRLVEWLSEHPKIQRRLYNGGYEVSPEECLEIMELLEKNEFYEMILILLMRNQQDAVLAEATSKLVVEKLVDEWRRIGTEQMCKDIKEKIREEIRLKEAGKSTGL